MENRADGHLHLVHADQFPWFPKCRLWMIGPVASVHSRWNAGSYARGRRLALVGICYYGFVTVRLCPAPSAETPLVPIRRRGIPYPGKDTLAAAHRESIRGS